VFIKSKVKVASQVGSVLSEKLARGMLASCLLSPMSRNLILEVLRVWKFAASEKRSAEGHSEAE